MPESRGRVALKNDGQRTKRIPRSKHPKPYSRNSIISSHAQKEQRLTQSILAPPSLRLSSAEELGACLEAWHSYEMRYATLNVPWIRRAISAGELWLIGFASSRDRRSRWLLPALSLDWCHGTIPPLLWTAIFNRFKYSLSTAS